VGEVTALRFDPQHTGQILATVAVEPDTPVRADTQVGLDFQGLTGAPAVSLRGGTSASPPPAAGPGQPGLLVADAAATEDVVHTARDALHRAETVLADNAEPIHSTITNLNTFAEALARNSDRIDGLLEGLERMTGGATPKAPPPTFDLTAPQAFPALGKPPQGRLAVLEPTALVMFDTQKILVQRNGQGIVPLENGQWSDTVPKLLQEKIIQSFENASYLESVERPVEGQPAEHQLMLDIRSFQIDLSKEPVARVAFSARIADADGRTGEARIFRASAPLKDLDPATAAAALNQAFDQAATDLVTWTSQSL
jgi:phospholipid/cholesterol/gamma-HCH transport system substrate-binding protein